METHMQDMSDVTAFFDDHAEAETAIAKLEQGGIPRENIRMVEGRDPSAAQQADAPEDEGFMAQLKDLFTGSDASDHDTYAEGLRRGGYLVSVRTPAADQDRVVEILDKDGSVDLDERSETWRAEGWSGGPQNGAHNGAPTHAARIGDTPADGTIEVVEEEMNVGKREVGGGRVRVSTHTVSDEVSEDVTLTSTRAHLDRRPVDRAVTDADAAFQDRTIEVAETSQEAVVEKTAHVVEEIDVGTDVETETETVTGTVRHTEVDIDDDRAEPTPREV